MLKLYTENFRYDAIASPTNARETVVVQLRMATANEIGRKNWERWDPLE
jgi:hypothetical protein